MHGKPVVTDFHTSRTVAFLVRGWLLSAVSGKASCYDSPHSYGCGAFSLRLFDAQEPSEICYFFVLLLILQ